MKSMNILASLLVSGLSSTITHSEIFYTNVALGKSVAASSVYEDNTNFSANRIVNGSTSETPGSYWLAKGTSDAIPGSLPAWLVIDLGQSYSVSGLSILNALNAPFNDRGTKDISVQYSTNGTNAGAFTTVINSNTLVWQNTSFQELPFATTIQARYIKININTTYGLRGAAALNEVKVNSPIEVNTAPVLTTIYDVAKGTVSITPYQTNYLVGDLVTLSATPLPGHLFNGWTGDVVTNSPSIVLTMSTNKTVTANFSQDSSDNDADGLSNYQEIVTYGTNPNLKDSNADSIEDGVAVILGYNPLFDFGALITYMKSNPPSGLYNQTQYNANRTNGRSDVLSNPNVYGLYNTNQIQNLGLGGIMLNRNTNNQLVLNYQILQSADLQNWSSYQQNELVISNAPSDKMFLRVQAVGQ